MQLSPLCERLQWRGFMSLMLIVRSRRRVLSHVRLNSVALAAGLTATNVPLPELLESKTPWVLLPLLMRLIFIARCKASMLPLRGRLELALLALASLLVLLGVLAGDCSSLCTAARELSVAPLTMTLPGTPFCSTSSATATVSPKRWYRGIFFPTTPAMTSPV